ncbi:MAG: lactate utilization protein [Hyphomicrobiaceae bacterium]
MTRPDPHAREHVLGRIRKSLGVGEDDAKRRFDVMRRLASPPGHTVPARAKLDRPGLVAAFRERLSAQGATFADAAGPADIPGLVARYLRDTNLPARIRMGADERLAGLDWSSEPNLERAGGRAEGSDLAGLSHALMGIAETGTLALVSGSDNPTTINFVPDTHIVVLREADIAGGYEAVWARLRADYGDRSMPRTLNWVSGPSRTADIEGVLIMGAHGPRRLHVIVVKDGG